MIIDKHKRIQTFDLRFKILCIGGCQKSNEKISQQ